MEIRSWRAATRNTKSRTITRAKKSPASNRGAFVGEDDGTRTRNIQIDSLVL